MLDKTKAVIFDLDGTLINSMWIWEQIDKDYLSSKGFSVPNNLKDEINHLSFYETAVYFKNKFSIDDSIEVILKTWNDMAYNHYLHNIKLKKGALNFLKYLKKNNIKTAIATSNSMNLLSAALECVKIKDYINVITTTNEVANGKNCPDVYLLTAKKLGVNPIDCIVFEDILEAVKGAKLANMKVIAVYDKAALYQKDDLIKTADKYILNFTELF